MILIASDAGEEGEKAKVDLQALFLELFTVVVSQ